jgi:hypothetical protein
MFRKVRRRALTRRGGRIAAKKWADSFIFGVESGIRDSTYP